MTGDSLKEQERLIRERLDGKRISTDNYSMGFTSVYIEESESILYSVRKYVLPFSSLKGDTVISLEFDSHVRHHEVPDFDEVEENCLDSISSDMEISYRSETQLRITIGSANPNEVKDGLEELAHCVDKLLRDDFFVAEKDSPPV